MISNSKKIEAFQAKLANEHSVLEGVIYTEAISMLNNDVNPDKVQNWVNNVLSSYTNKPRPLSEKDKQRMEEASARKKANREEKDARFNLLNNKMRDLLDEYGVVVIGFFDWKQMRESEYTSLMQSSMDKGYFFTDIGDGAMEPFVSKKELNKEFFKQFNELDWDLSEFSKGNILDEFKTYDSDVFRIKIK